MPQKCSHVFIPVASSVKCMKRLVPCWKPTVTICWMTISSSQFILFSEEVDPIATPAADFSLCIFDRYSFIFCEPGTGTKLLHSMIYDIPSQQRMKNKLDFPTPFPDQPPTTTTATNTTTGSPPSFHRTCFSLPDHECGSSAVKTNTEGMFTLSVLQKVWSDHLLIYYGMLTNKICVSNSPSVANVLANSLFTPQ